MRPEMMQGQLLVACVAVLLSNNCQAEKGDTFLTLGVHVLEVDGFRQDSDVTFDLGKINTQSISLGLDYFLTDQWSVSLTLPYIRSKFGGDARSLAHHPSILDAPNDSVPFLDDGDFHSSWQNASLGFRYDTTVGDYLLTPYVYAHIPIRDYEHFGFAAVGYNVSRLELGAEVAKRIEYSNFYWLGSYSYNFQEKILGINKNHHLFLLELGYFFSPRLSAKLLTFGRKGKGLKFADIVSFSDELWFHHDQVLQHNFVQAGAGLDFTVNGDYSVNFTASTLIWGEEVNNLTYNMNLEIVRAF